MSDHVHECVRDTPDHGVCRCECGATAWNNMGETDWDNPLRSEATPKAPAAPPTAALLSREELEGMVEKIRHSGYQSLDLEYLNSRNDGEIHWLDRLVATARAYCDVVDGKHG